MDKYTYGLCNRKGYNVLRIESAFTNLSYGEYCDEYIVPLLPILSASHDERVLLDERTSYLALIDEPEIG